MKYLVTGAGGYLGQHVVLTLARWGVPYVAIDRKTCDLTDPVQVRATFIRLRRPAPSPA